MSHTAWRSKNWEGNIGINTPWSAPALAFEQVQVWWLLQKRLTTTSVNSLPCNIPKQPSILPYFQVFISPKLSFQFPVVFVVDVETLLVPKCLRLPLSAHTPEKLVSSDENFAEGMFEVGASALAKQSSLSESLCWPLDSSSREPIRHQEKSSSGVFSAMIAPPCICLEMCRLI